jgi:TonB-linked SusC/RagA family outer membrane protein
MHFLCKREQRAWYCHEWRLIPATKFNHLFFKIMKISTMVCLLTFTGAFTLSAKGSHAQNMKEVKISLDEQDNSLDMVLAHIEKVSVFHFVYQSNQVKQQRVKRFKVDQVSIESVLTSLLKPRGFTFKQLGENIIIDQAQISAHIPSNIVETSVQSAVRLTGKITDERGEALPGVTVMIKESRQMVSSQSDGSYTVRAEVGQTLVFSYLGYRKVEKIIGGSSAINVTLQSESNLLNDVVVVGYGTQKRGDVTTAISSLKATDINNFTATGVDKAMTGKMAGVQVLEPNGAPGAGIAIAIRGKSTITAGTQPLIVVDGIPLSESNTNGPGMTQNALNAINMSDIESLDVLKDASATAIYGSRGANGVILITTKRGKKDKPSINYDGYAGFQQVQKKIKMLDAYQYAQLIYDAHNNAYFDLLEDKGLTGSVNDDNATRLAKLGGPEGATNQAYVLPPEIFPYLEGLPGLTNSDWQDAIFRNASIQNHTLSIAGGSDNVKYYVSGNYLNQQGVVIQSGFKRYGGRVNLDAAYKKFNLGATINYNYEDYQFQPTEGRFASQEFIVPIALTAAPFFPIYNPDGSYNYSQYNYQFATSQTINPVALANLKTDDTRQGKLLGNVFAQYHFTPELSNKVSFGINIMNANRNTFRPSTLPRVSPSSPTSTPEGSYRNVSLTNWLVENTLAYDKRFGEHSVNAVAVLSAQKDTYSNLVANATGYANDLITTINGATTVPSFGGGMQQWTLLSALARVQYSYRGKYLASAAIRADGSSRFGANSKYGYFPSLSMGWNIDREDFMQNIATISSLKIRGSFGQTGNFQIPDYAYLSTLSPANYVFGPSGSIALHNGLYQSTPGNENLSWEKTTAFNVGLDLGLWKERLHLTVDAYTNNTSGLLLNVPVPKSSGYSNSLQNIGKVNNKGLEFTLTGNNQIGQFHLTNSANISFNRNKVLDLGGAQSIITQIQGVIYFITEVGKPIGNYYTLVQDGIFKNEAELNDPNTPRVPGAKVGDMKFRDINGDGLIDGTNDRAITGNYMPNFTYGFSSQLQYKALDLGVSLQGVYGNEIANINSRYINSLESFTNNMAEALDRFYAEDNPGSGTYPRANRSQRGLNANMSTYSIKSGSYLRIRDITLGFTLSEKVATKVGLGRARIYLTATNPFMFTKYNAYNPEISQAGNSLTPGVDYGSYPLSKSYVLGFNLTF